MECFGACTSGKDGETSSGAVVRREQCSCGRSDKSLVSRRSFNKTGSYKRTHSYSQKSWRPLLLFIPLRLGLNEINPAYYNALKVCFYVSLLFGLISEVAGNRGRVSHVMKNKKCANFISF